MSRVIRSSPRTHSLPGAVLQVLGLCGFLVVVVFPVLSIIWSARTAPAIRSSEGLLLVLPLGRRLGLLARSVGLALSVAIGGTLVGVFAGLWLWQRSSRTGTLIQWLALVLIAVPPYIHALSWSAAMTSLSRALQAFTDIPLRFMGEAAAGWVQLMSLLPAAVGLGLIGLKSVDPALIDCGRLLRSDGACFTRIIVPIAGPYLLAGAGLLFCQSLLDYSVPSLYQVNVYSLEIFAEYSASAEPIRAFLTGVPLVAIAAVVIALSQSRLRHAAVRQTWKRDAWLVAPSWPRPLAFAQWCAVLVVVLQISVPLMVLLSTAGDLRELATTLSLAREEISFTVGLALLAALITLLLVVPVARELGRGDRRAGGWWILVVLQLAIPGPLVGIGLIGLWRRLSPHVIYGSAIMPVFANAARFAPWAAIVMHAHMRRLDPSLWEAARIANVGRARRLIWVYLPMLAPGLLAAASLVAALSAGELAATLIVAPPGHATLAMRIYNYLHYGASSSVASLCLAMAIMAVAGGAIAAFVLAGWSRLYGEGERA